MQRKVIQIANSTQLISLPRRWCKKYSIKKGDSLDVIENGNQVTVQTEKLVNYNEIELDTSGMGTDLLRYLIRSLYKNGYDEVKLIYKNNKIENIRKNQMDDTIYVIEREVSKLTGIEIFDQKENYCIIKSISTETMKEFDTMLKQIFILTSSTIKDLIKGYENNNIGLLKTIRNKHDSINKFTTYCQRILNKSNDSKHKKKEIMYHLLEVIDIMMDLLKSNARDLIENQVPTSKKGTEVYNMIQEAFDKYHTLYFNFDLKKVTEFNRIRFQVKGMINDYSKEINNEELGILTNMEHIFQYILRLVVSRMTLEY